MNKISGNAAVFTIGCRLNQADSALICDRLEREGWHTVAHDSTGRIDLLVINSCTVTCAAAQKSRQAAHKFRRLHPEACIIVTGCSAEIDKSFWKEDNAADVILTNPEKKDIGELITSFLQHKSIVTGSRF
ncbi:MAG: hypothetical protein WC071_12325, partial [Victivallaceae bacterium]